METGESVTVERGGKPAVVVAPVAEYEHLLEMERKRREDWWKRLDALHARIRAEIGDRPVPDTVELIREMREERSRELDEVIGVVR
jgi:hypothetical protein